MTPSADRTAMDADNKSTFILTNVLPHALQHNRGLWAQLEAVTRAEVTAGNEVSIIAGGSRTQGTFGTSDDLACIMATTRAVALWTLKDADITGKCWQDYSVSVCCIEQRTGLDLLSAVANDVEAALAGAPCAVALVVMVYLPLLMVVGICGMIVWAMIGSWNNEQTVW